MVRLIFLCVDLYTGLFSACLCLHEDINFDRSAHAYSLAVFEEQELKSVSSLLMIDVITQGARTPVVYPLV